jgi:hypothetical protein
MNVVLLEVVAFGAVRVLASHPVGKELFYRIPDIDHDEYEEYLANRHPQLGWPSPYQMGGDDQDLTGARPLPAFPEPGNECLSIYGDSFAFASDVGDEDAWSNVLATQFGCRVANFGVGAYGTDQAVLRFELNTEDRAPITIFAFFPIDVLRSLTRFSYLTFGIYWNSFKPRFALQNGELQLLPMPTVMTGDLKSFVRDPAAYLEPDGLLPDTRHGPSRVEFPYTLALGAGVTHERVINWLRGRPSWAGYLTPGHDSGGFELTLAIIERFDRSCRARGKRCVVLLLPTPVSYRNLLDDGTNFLAPLAQGMEAADIEHIDLALHFRQRLGGRSYCELLVQPDACAGHYSPEGNAVLAEIVHQHLSRVIPRNGTRASTSRARSDLHPLPPSLGIAGDADREGKTSAE